MVAVVTARADAAHIRLGRGRGVRVAAIHHRLRLRQTANAAGAMPIQNAERAGIKNIRVERAGAKLAGNIDVTIVIHDDGVRCVDRGGTGVAVSHQSEQARGKIRADLDDDARLGTARRGRATKNRARAAGKSAADKNIHTVEINRRQGHARTKINRTVSLAVLRADPNQLAAADEIKIRRAWHHRHRRARDIAVRDLTTAVFKRERRAARVKFPQIRTARFIPAQHIRRAGEQRADGVVRPRVHRGELQFLDKRAGRRLRRSRDRQSRRDQAEQHSVAEKISEPGVKVRTGFHGDNFQKLLVQGAHSADVLQMDDALGDEADVLIRTEWLVQAEDTFAVSAADAIYTKTNLRKRIRTGRGIKMNVQRPRHRVAVTMNRTPLVTKRIRRMIGSQINRVRQRIARRQRTGHRQFIQHQRIRRRINPRVF